MKRSVLILTAFDQYSYNVRVKYLDKYFEDKDYKVTVLSADFDHRSKRECKIKRRNLEYVHVKPYRKNLSIARIISHREFAKRAFKFAEKMEPEIIYAIAPPNFLFKYADEYKKKHKDTTIVFGIGDMWPETLPIAENTKKIIMPCLNIWKYLRNNYIKCADGIVYECELFKEHLQKVIPNVPNKTIYLTKDLEGKQTSASVPQVKTGLNFCYVGSLNNIFDEDLTSKLLNEIALFCPVKLHLIGDGEKKGCFLGSLKNVEVIDYGIVYDEVEKAKIYAQCHIALNLMKTNVFVGLTMKSIEYFAAGLPVLNNIPEDTQKIIEENDCGINYSGDMVEIIEWLKSLTDDKIKKMKSMSYRVYEDYFTIRAFQRQMDDFWKEVI